MSLFFFLLCSALTEWTMTIITAAKEADAMKMRMVGYPHAPFIVV